jgi:carboxymethylenebutenolidase
MRALCAKLAAVTTGKDVHMSGQNIKVRASAGGEFDCYVVAPETGERVPAIVLASAVHGVDADVRAIADEFAAQGFLAAAPDLFWRVLPGPLARDDGRAKERAQPRLPSIRTGEADLVDTLAMLRKRPEFNGQAAVIGFCYGGPYAILGPKRLGYAAGIACHGTQMLDFIGELDGVRAPLCIIWGDQDFAAPAEVLAAYRNVPARMNNVEVHIFPGVLHGYMMPGNKAAFSAETRAFSMGKALALLEGLRSAPARRAM